MENMTILKKYTVEYHVKSTPRLLYNYLHSPDGLDLWFAEKVTVKDNIYHFYWNGSEQQAKLVSKKENDHVRFKWLENDDDEECYFEFKINIEPVTNDIALLITDYADDSDIKSAKLLWDVNVSKLLRLMGSDQK
jgi:uncharacterized protein YndB with AHSA1/START domain